MGIGFSIFLLAAGAILAFAVHATVAGLDISIVGWILMAAGAIGLVLTMVVLTPRRRRAALDPR
jgi:Flp pilus assembly protein protease CpaA